MRYLASASCLLLAWSCVKDKPSPVAVAPVPSKSVSQHWIYIANEGNFQAGNASVSLYDPTTGGVTENVFGDRNSGQKLGDVAQSIAFHNSLYFIVVNNSGKIVVCDNAMKKLREITGMPSPRYMHFLDAAHALVSDYKAQGVHVVNIESGTVESKIPLPGFTERFCAAGSYVFVANAFRDYVYAINPASKQVADSVYVGPSASSLVCDRNSKLWVLASGDQQKGIKARLSQIDPGTLGIVKSFEFDAQDFPSRLCMNRRADTLYYLLHGVRRMSVQEGSLPAADFFSVQGANFYALGIDPYDGNVYVSDALDYVQRSQVYVCQRNGSLLKSFKAGITSTDFYFGSN